MKKYQVTLKLVGTASIVVEANGPEEAIQEASEAIAFDNIDSWDTTKKDAEVEEVEADE